MITKRKNTGFFKIRQSGFLLYEMLVTLSLLAGASYALAQLAQQGYQQYYHCHKRINACRVVQSVTDQIRSGALSCTNQAGRHGDTDYRVAASKKYPGLALALVNVVVDTVSIETMVLCA